MFSLYFFVGLIFFCTLKANILIHSLFNTILWTLIFFIPQLLMGVKTAWFTVFWWSVLDVGTTTTPTQYQLHKERILCSCWPPTVLQSTLKFWMSQSKGNKGKELHCVVGMEDMKRSVRNKANRSVFTGRASCQRRTLDSSWTTCPWQCYYTLAFFVTKPENSCFLFIFPPAAKRDHVFTCRCAHTFVVLAKYIINNWMDLIN